jgi:hypothetical protein
MTPLVVLALLGLSAPATEKPKLVLDAPRVQSLPAGLAAQGYGKRVDVTARLDGEPEDPEEYYCLDEIWDWGDGTESVHENDCDPYEEGVELGRDFQESHYYRRGQYTITFRLKRGDETVVKGAIDVRIQ